MNVDPNETSYEQLLSRLRSTATALDPVPDDVVRVSQGLYALRTLDADLAELVADSLDTAGAVRGPAAVRLLAYEANGVTLELEVSQSGDSRALLGEVTGAITAVTLETTGGSQEVAVDDAGRFQMADVPAGPMRLRCTAADGSAVATVWTRI
jgi:hypothetical protein